MEKIQILMSTYNGEKYLEEQILSILNQSYKSFSLLIRDDGSTDSTKSILSDYERKYKQIEVIYGENVGVVSSFFELIASADLSVPFYAFCDQDDFWEVDKICTAINKLKLTDKELPNVYASDYNLVDENLNVMNIQGMPRIHDTSFGSSLIQNVVTGCTAVFNNTMLLYMRREKDCSQIVMHDWWLYLIASSFGEIVFDTNKTIMYRQHQNNVVGSKGVGFSKYFSKFLALRKRPRGQIKKQSEEFLKVYGPELSSKNKKTLLYLTGKKNFIQRLSILFNINLRRQNFIDTIIFKIFYILELI